MSSSNIIIEEEDKLSECHVLTEIPFGHEIQEIDEDDSLEPDILKFEEFTE